MHQTNLLQLKWLVFELGLPISYLQIFRDIQSSKKIHRKTLKNVENIVTNPFK